VSITSIKRIAVVGAGLMGHGIAQEFALAGYSVSLSDLDEERLVQARDNIENNLKMLGLTAESDLVAEKLTTAADMPVAVRDADLVIEAISENLSAKRSLFAKLDSICKPETILASNTSTFMPSQLAEATNRPSQVLVAHYFNPPYLVPLVEVVASQTTSSATIDTVRDILISIGKKPVVLEKESLGFIANRLQAALLRECFALVENGVASPNAIDTVVKSSIGRRLAVAGPFEIFDAAGADVWNAISEQLMPDIESSSQVPPMMSKLVSDGNLGLKTGRGVHEWTDDTAAELRSRIAHFLQEMRRWDQDE
jgi:3-hydroxybutyryl-CoA dehydrogenase